MSPPVTTVDAKGASQAKLASGPGTKTEPFDGGSDGPLYGASPPPPARLFRVAMYALLLAVSMTFAVLSSAYVFLVAHPHNWKPITLPPLVWLSTVLILAGSYSLVRAVRSLERGQLPVGRYWLTLTLAAALGFLASQMGAWFELSRSGLIEAGNQQRSFFIILSVTHGVHVLGGLVGLVYLRVRAQSERPVARFPLPAAGRIIGLFWHFMAGIWVFLLTLLLVWK